MIRRTLGARGYALLLVATCALFGCNADDGNRIDTSGADSLNDGIVSADSTTTPRTVVITLREYELAMPTTLVPGAYLFSVRNEGSEPHGLEIEGNGMELSLPAEVQPGEVQTLPIDLAPGTYRVYCPLGKHEDRGMTINLTVTE